MFVRCGRMFLRCFQVQRNVAKDDGERRCPPRGGEGTGIVRTREFASTQNVERLDPDCLPLIFIFIFIFKQARN